MLALDFFEHVDEGYGHSSRDSVPTVEEESINVPEVRFTLRDGELERLSAMINPSSRK